jgi:hypothetical protein
VEEGLATAVTERAVSIDRSTNPFCFDRDAIDDRWRVILDETKADDLPFAIVASEPSAIAAAIERASDPAPDQLVGDVMVVASVFLRRPGRLNGVPLGNRWSNSVARGVDLSRLLKLQRVGSFPADDEDGTFERYRSKAGQTFLLSQDRTVGCWKDQTDPDGAQRFECSFRINDGNVYGQFTFPSKHADYIQEISAEVLQLADKLAVSC